MGYLDEANNFMWKVTEPFALYNTGQNWLLFARYWLRNDFRAFRLDRIVTLSLPDEKFKPQNHDPSVIF